MIAIGSQVPPKPRARLAAFTQLEGSGGLPWLLAVQQSVREAFRSLVTRKLWSAVTLLGILVGSAGMLTVDALQRSQSAAFAAQVAQLGSNRIQVTPGGTSVGGVRVAGAPPSLTARDVAAIQRQVAGIAAMSPEDANLEWVVVGRQRWETQIVGVEPSAQRIQNDAVQRGRFLGDADEATGARVIVLGQTAVDHLFGGADPVGQSVRIRNVEFQVVGVLGRKGHNDRSDLDDVALIPFSTAQQRLFGFAKINSILIQSTGPESIPTVVAGVRKALEASHRLAPGHPDDFTVTNNQTLLELTQQQSSFFPRMLTGVALIALLLGGVGVLNVMLMAVADRTPEIGLRLAVGAQPRNIQLQFLVEALTLTLIGGLGGTLTGVAASAAIPRVVSELADFPTMPTASAIVIAFGVSVLIGLAFGFYPARAASRLDPIAVLRSG